MAPKPRTSKKAAADTRVKGYPNLYRNASSGVYYFRKWSSLKGKQFSASTKIRDNAARAYKAGLDAYNDWIGKVADESGVIYFGRFAKKYLNAKLDSAIFDDDTKRTFKNQLEASSKSTEKSPRPRLLDFFGHLAIDRVNNPRFQEFVAQVSRVHPGFRFFNARKALREILGAAKAEGYIHQVPDFPIAEERAAPPVYLSKETILRILRKCHYADRIQLPGGAPGRIRRRSAIKLLAFIMWKQGARPGEILQYEWEMIDFKDGPTGTLRIPARISKTRRARAIPLNAKVSRILRFLKPHAESRYLFPSRDSVDRPAAAYVKGWNGACRRAKVSGTTIYQLRDTFITDALKRGLSSVFIGRYCDTSPAMIDRKYAVAETEVMRRVAG